MVGASKEKKWIELNGNLEFVEVNDVNKKNDY